MNWTTLPKTLNPENRIKVRGIWKPYLGEAAEMFYDSYLLEFILCYMTNMKSFLNSITSPWPLQAQVKTNNPTSALDGCQWNP
jgi:hypothetical protein